MAIFTDDQLRRRDIDTLKQWLRRKLGGYAVAITDIRRDNLLYRGVPWPDRPTRIDHVSYPPAEIVKLGRANRAGSPMFYASAAGPAVFYELRAKAGDRIALAEWHVTEPLWMHHLGFYRDAFQRMGGGDEVRDPRVMEPIPDESRANAKLRRELGLAFTYDVPEGKEYRYKGSVAIHERLFDGAGPLPTALNGPRHDRAAGTVYPALQMRGAADNVVLWPQFVDSSLRVNSIRYVRVEAVD
jgi:hypothetical protein